MYTPGQQLNGRRGHNACNQKLRGNMPSRLGHRLLGGKRSNQARPDRLPPAMRFVPTLACQRLCSAQHCRQVALASAPAISSI